MDRVWCWLDMEMTGLNPKKDKILEIGAIITPPYEPDNHLQIVEIHIHTPKESWFPKARPIVQEMHTRNGLIEKCHTSGITIQEADKVLQEVLGNHEMITLVGNSVHFDRSFLVANNFKAERLIHHRHLDISSVGIFMDPLIDTTFEKGDTHRAIDDIRECMEQYKFYVKGVKENGH